MFRVSTLILTVLAAQISCPFGRFTRRLVGLMNHSLGIPACLTIVLLLQAPDLFAQHYLPRAEIRVEVNKTLIVASDPRPLLQAVQGLRARYGWLLPYEDPVYTDQELLDISRPDLGDRPRQYTRIAGGEFRAEFPSTDGIQELTVVEKIVTAYNQSGNPGKFMVRPAGSDFAVVGINTSADRSPATKLSVLDTLVNIPEQQRSTGETIEAILNAVAAKTGRKLALASGPVNRLQSSKVNIGAVEQPAREALLKTLAGMGGVWSWNLLYDPNTQTYMFNVVPLSQ